MCKQISGELEATRRDGSATYRFPDSHGEVGTPFSPLGLVCSGDEILVQRNAALEEKSPSPNSKFISPVLRPLRPHDRASVKEIQSL